jgi:hypothetical protein
MANSSATACIAPCKNTRSSTRSGSMRARAFATSQTSLGENALRRGTGGRDTKVPTGQVRKSGRVLAMLPPPLEGVRVVIAYHDHGPEAGSGSSGSELISQKTATLLSNCMHRRTIKTGNGNYGGKSREQHYLHPQRRHHLR